MVGLTSRNWPSSAATIRRKRMSFGFYNTGDRMKYWGKWGAFWGGSGVCSSVRRSWINIPGIGPVVAAGSIVTWIVAALEGAVVVGGLSALGAGLYSLSVPKNSVVKYETSIKAGKFVLVAHGTAGGSGEGSRDVEDVRRGANRQLRTLD